jgi:acyl-coenzyme A thioesterase 9
MPASILKYYPLSMVIKILGRKLWVGRIRKYSHGVTFHEVDKTPITAQLWDMRIRSSTNDSAATRNAASIAKSIDSSRLVIKYPFLTDFKLRDMYVDHTGQLLIGKIFEDLDAFAGNIAHSHCDDNDPATHRLSLVTASVDKIVINNRLELKSDLYMAGHVAWVGKSSLDVRIVIESASVTPRQHNNGAVLLTSFFKYVARDRSTGMAAPVNQLTGLAAEDQKLFEQRQLLVENRKKQQAVSVSSDQSHIREIMDLVDEGSAVEDMPTLCRSHCILMKQTQHENAFICQPQNVNTAGRVFGGFISTNLFFTVLLFC